MSKTYYWHNKRATFSRGKGKAPVGFGEEMPNISEEQKKLYLEKGWISTEKTVTAHQLSELESLRAQVAELKKGGDSAEVEKLKAENAELKANAGVDHKLSEAVESLKEVLANIQQTDKKEELWEAIKSVKETLEQV